MSWQLAALRRAMRWTARPVVARLTNWTRARAVFRVSARLAFRRVRGTRCRPAEGPLAPGAFVTGREPPAPGVILYLHGGAYIVGSPAAYRDLAGRLARQTGRRLYLPDYPLAPEHPAPAAFHAAVAAWEALLGEGYRPGEIVIGGDSAGGGLALALLAEVLSRGQRPAGCFAFSPWTDLTLSGASLRENAGRDVLLPVARIAEVRDLVRGALAPDDPRLSPLFAAFPDCPPVLLAWSQSEILRDDSARMAAHLRGYGAQVEEDVLPDAPHVWQLFHGIVPEANASLNKTAAFILRALPSPRPAGS
ncbi:alpha/beta hydrolase fold domain-containing protein [Psychromarinibacter sp. C21-152]|uniref:Alpha/beta hydrolase fold domain-containing protein n=1 Tax=Psychromarinibacter sediminicola TaxID=3033385 RepID=A0AAE3TAN5_9RHOB|nr:alpha/beta hydrolase fold domain-containing protein [Psychromarinibacter sediminicola]MDF0603038.1 alpha/beta hydrolase fold domain-containing protein [Psychromarinibacter sediminicola]